MNTKYDSWDRFDSEKASADVDAKEDQASILLEYSKILSDQKKSSEEVQAQISATSEALKSKVWSLFYICNFKSNPHLY